MASLGLSPQEVRENLGMVMGIGRNSSNWGATTLSDMNRIMRSGRRRFLSAHDWNFLKTIVTLTVRAPDERTVTKVGSAFTPDTAWSTDPTHQILVVDGRAMRVTGESTGDALVSEYEGLPDNITDPTPATLYYISQSLPDYIQGVQAPVTVEGENRPLEETALLPEYEIRRLRSAARAHAGAPRLFTTVVTPDADRVGIHTTRLEVYPLPDRAYSLQAPAQITLDDATSVDSSDPVFHPLFSECLMECILAQAESYFNNQADGPHMAKFAQLLPEAIRVDRKLEGSRRLLPRRDSAQRGSDPLYELRIAPVDFQ